VATQGRRKDIALSERLRQEPWRFEFFQAVRLLELMAQERKPVGYDFPAEQEVVRFLALASRSFPAGSIARIGAGRADRDKPAAPQMQVAFMGLTGPAGVLPESYLELLLQRQRDRDFALRDFLDLFNHRTISLFYRAWEKYRFPVSYERAHRTPGAPDLFTGCLECLVGTGTRKLKGRLPFRDEVLLRYAGHFAHFPRSAVVLEAILANYLQVAVRVEQFVGRWLALDIEQRTAMPSAACPGGRFNQLGVDLVIGTQVWDVQSTFRIRVGPLRHSMYASLLPGTEGLRQLMLLARMYAGPELDFEVQLVLEAAEVPRCRLGGRRGVVSHLGWNAWLCSRAPAVDRDDARFRARGLLPQVS